MLDLPQGKKAFLSKAQKIKKMADKFDYINIKNYKYKELKDKQQL